MSGIELASSQSIKPFRSSEEYLDAMKEDLAEWLRELYGADVRVTDLGGALETGALLCAHANHVTRAAADFRRKHGSAPTPTPTPLPTAGVTFVRAAQPNTFLARDNVSNFISWCRNQMKVQDVLMFETDDLVLRKNEKNVVLCLLEVARRASRFGMSAPTLIQLEQEIEEEIRVENDPQKPSQPPPRKGLLNTPDLDNMVQHLISRCSCPTQFPMVKISDGKYRVGDSSTLIFVRILRSHVMVRVGGGWDALEHYLDKHDPCRCTSLTHKLAQRPATPVHEIKARPCGPDGQSGPQTPLVVSRVQSPLEPVIWTPSSPSRSQREGTSPRPSRSPDPGLRNAPSSNAFKERASTPPCRQTYSENKDNSTLKSTSRTGREATRLSPSPRQASSLPRPVRPSTPLQPEIQRPSTPLVLQRIYSHPTSLHQQQCTDNRLGQTWTKAQFVSKLRQNATAGSKGIQETLNVSDKSGTLPSARHIQCVTSLSTKQDSLGTRPTISIQKTENGGNDINNPDFIRTFCPSKGLMGVISGATNARSLSPTRIGYSPPTTPSLDRHERSLQRCSPHVDRKLYLDLPRQTVPKSPINKSDSNLNATMSQAVSEARCEEGEIESNILYTPPPISPAQEAVLYQSLEEEILSNLQQLGMESDESDSDNNQHDSHAGIPMNSSESPKPCSTSRPNGRNDANFDDVIDELSNRRKPLEKITLGNWVNTLSRDFGGGKQGNHKETTPSQPEVSMVDSWSFLDSSMNSVHPPCASEANRIVGTVVPLNSCNSETSQEKHHGSSSFGERRSLKKPERVPSIYKLKLRPCIRPRLDHRPDKKPSKIPRPVSNRTSQCERDSSDANRLAVDNTVTSAVQKRSSAPHRVYSMPHVRKHSGTVSTFCPASMCTTKRRGTDGEVEQEFEFWV